MTSQTFRGLSRLWPLLYLVQLVVQPLFDASDRAVQWTAIAVAVAVFVPVYTIAGTRPGRIRRWSPLTATLVGSALFPFNAAAGVFFVFAAALAGSHLPRQTATRWLVGLTALLGVVAVLSPTAFPWRIFAFAPAQLFVWVVGLACLEGAERRRHADALRAENVRIEHVATLTERERIARDLHDLLGHTLTGILVRAQLVQRLVRADPAAAAAEAADVERVARDALAQVRATVAGWRQVDLDEELVAARGTLAAAGVELVCAGDPALELRPAAETALALAVREAVTNVVRHAHARRCTIAVRGADRCIRLDVADDGSGAAAPDGAGLTGMRERVGALGGEVRRAAAAGTAITVTLPQAAPR